MKMPDSQIAVTLFNLRDYCKTESDLDRTLDRVCEIGYQAVQVSAVPLPAEVIKKQLDKHALFCCATHENLAVISGESAPLIDKMKTLECDFVALGAPPSELRGTVENAQKVVDIFNEKGAELLEAGIRLGYHNHNFEFERLPGRHQTYFEYFYANTNPQTVFAEVDVHWITRGGGSPVSWIHRLGHRMPVIHFKDFTIIDNDKPVFCEIGEGNLDWGSILVACRETGIRWYSIEQDALFKDRDIFESIKISYNNLRAMGVK